ncbi:MAG: hypothetical protein HY725_08765 [Candidatus Rokubacteria bacterium]|nr:hypothetical protein [Candidatus Rokubacteria bacterium]
MILIAAEACSVEASVRHPRKRLPCGCRGRPGLGIVQAGTPGVRQLYPGVD